MITKTYESFRPIYDPIPAVPLQILRPPRALHILGENRGCQLAPRAVRVDQDTLTMISVRETADIAVKWLPMLHRPMHFAPHVSAVVHVVLLRYIKVFVSPLGDGGLVDGMTTIGVCKPLPPTQMEEV